MREMVVGNLILFAILLAGCADSPGMSAIDFYLQSLNLDRLPDEVSNFRGEGSDAFPVFVSAGYFKYKATPSYFEILFKHARFKEKNDFNRQIHAVKCDGPEMATKFSYWTKEVIDIKGKSCFAGTFFPYVHYIIYDPTTTEVYHFITGMRD